jgi:hypothetical protein
MRPGADPGWAPLRRQRYERFPGAERHLFTPSVTDNIIEGSPAAVLELAQNELGLQVVERTIDRGVPSR